MIKPTLDRIDFEILRLLQKDARISNKQLAAAVNLAASSCHERLKRLWQTGIIRGATIDIDLSALGYGLEALVFLGLTMHTRAVVDQFLADVVDVTEVRSARLVTGRNDVIVHVVVRDMLHLKNLVLDNFTNRPGVTRVETSIIYESVFRREPALPDPAPINS
jgi:DNA-binding Lrp family transcriptional regulator